MSYLVYSCPALLNLGHESEWIAHQYHLFGLESFLLVLRRILAAGAPALRPTIPIILETFTIEFQAPRV